MDRARQGLVTIGAGIAICLATWGLWAYNKSKWEDDEMVREVQDRMAAVIGSSAGPVSGGSFNSAPYIVAAVVGAMVALAGVIVYAGAPSASDD